MELELTPKINTASDSVNIIELLLLCCRLTCVGTQLITALFNVKCEILRSAAYIKELRGFTQERFLKAKILVART